MADEAKQQGRNGSSALVKLVQVVVLTECPCREIVREGLFGLKPGHGAASACMPRQLN